MKAKPTAPDAPDMLAQRTAELDVIRKEIVAAEAGLPALALDPDDAKYEAASLHIERLRRSELRASKRFEAAREALVAAKAAEEQKQRRRLFEAGTKAESEVERLAAEYGKRAAAVAETLQEINKHAEVIRVGNENRPDYTPWSAPYGLRIYEGVRLPAAVKSGATIWPLDEPRGRTWQPPAFAELPPPVPRADPAAPSTMSPGARRYVMPLCDFGRPAQ